MIAGSCLEIFGELLCCQHRTKASMTRGRGLEDRSSRYRACEWLEEEMSPDVQPLRRGLWTLRDRGRKVVAEGKDIRQTSSEE